MSWRKASISGLWTTAAPPRPMRSSQGTKNGWRCTGIGRLRRYSPWIVERGDGGLPMQASESSNAVPLAGCRSLRISSRLEDSEIQSLRAFRQAEPRSSCWRVVDRSLFSSQGIAFKIYESGATPIARDKQYICFLTDVYYLLFVYFIFCFFLMFFWLLCFEFVVVVVCYLFFAWKHEHT